MEDLFKQVLTARVYDLAIRTPLDLAVNLSKRVDNQVYLKREDLQPAFSFKIRGAYNRIAHLSASEKECGIICASAGNHAQGVAMSARHLGIEAIIVMPRTTPGIKVRAVENLGAKVELVGDSYTEAEAYAHSLEKETGKIFIHPFDDPLVIAGQGTIAHELLQQCPALDYVFVPIGGGGLIGGISAFLKTLQPGVKVIGVQPEDSTAMMQSIAKGKKVVLKEVGLFADGVAVKNVGNLTYQIVQKFVDDIIPVSTDEICSAIKSIYEDTRSIMEPAGALGVAGLRKYLTENNITGKQAVAINSGANMNFNRLQFVAERTMTGEKQEALFGVTIPESPGSLKKYCEVILGDRNITEFNYRLSDRSEAHIFVGVSISNEKERFSFHQQMRQQGFQSEDLTDNDLAKTHIRHMVGGRSPNLKNEVLYRFQFPERPTALREFLVAMSESWNISLFHYRMHGADFGRVLVGFEIPSGDKEAFQNFLDKLNYAYAEETNNNAYQMFL